MGFPTHGSGRVIRVFVAAAVIALAWPNSSSAQAERIPAPETLAFEVASIRPEPVADPPRISASRIVIQPGGRLDATASLYDLVRYAYDLQPGQDLIGSQQVLHARFVIDARTAEGVVFTRDVSRALLRRLLADRFDLRVRVEEQTRDVFVLRRTNNDTVGARIRPAPADCPQDPGSQDRPDPCRHTGWVNGELTARVHGMADVAQFLARFCTAVPVIDETGLDDRYELETTFDPASCPGGTMALMRMPALEALPTVSDALRRDLGLRLDRDSRPQPILIVEHVDEPIPN